MVSRVIDDQSLDLNLLKDKIERCLGNRHLTAGNFRGNLGV